MGNPMSWNPGSGPNQSIVEGNPEESDPYAKWHDFNAWEDDI